MLSWIGRPILLSAIASSLLLSPQRAVDPAKSTPAFVSTRDVDVSGDGTKAHFEYRLTRTDRGYSADLVAKTYKGETIWGDAWNMTEGDLQVLMEEEGRKSVDEWVKKFFDNRPFTAHTFEKKKLTEADLVPEFMTEVASTLKVNPIELTS